MIGKCQVLATHTYLTAPLKKDMKIEYDGSTHIRKKTTPSVATTVSVNKTEFKPNIFTLRGGGRQSKSAVEGKVLKNVILVNVTNNISQWRLTKGFQEKADKIRDAITSMMLVDTGVGLKHPHIGVCNVEMSMSNTAPWPVSYTARSKTRSAIIACSSS